MDIREGLTTGSEQYVAPGDQEQIRAQTAASRAGIDAEDDAIRASVFADDPTSIKAGLEVFTEESVREAKRDADPYEQRKLAFWDAALAEEERKRERDIEQLVAYQQRDLIDNFVALSWGGDDEEQVLAWTALSPESRVWLVDDGTVSVEEARAFDAKAQRGLEQRGEVKVALAAAQQQLQNFEAVQALVVQLATDNNFSEAQMDVILNRANESLFAATGLDHTTADPNTWIAAVNGAAAAQVAEDKAVEDARFKQDVLLSGDTSIASGLSQSVPGKGHMPLNPVPRIEPRPDYSLVGAAMEYWATRETAEDIRRSVAAPSPFATGDEGMESVQRKAMALLGERI
jgi:hypothetical protein